MRAYFTAVCSAALLCVTAARAGDLQQGSTFHADIARTGNFVVPGLNWIKAARLHRETAFDGTTTGNVNTQPLYWRAPGASHGMVIVATDRDMVEALDSVTGSVIWRRLLGRPDPHPVPNCGTARDEGVYSTPVIDPASGTLYTAGSIKGDAGRDQYGMWALSLKDGGVLPGWPIIISTALASFGRHFIPLVHDQRTALTLANGTVYAGFAANHGDCGSYHGWIVGVDAKTAAINGSWRARGERGGVWATGGVTSDGTSLFAATGNAIEQGWEDGETVFRFDPHLHRVMDTADYFVPTDFESLDNQDLDLGGMAPLPLDIPDSDGNTAHWILQIGKGGVVYILNRNNLGGIGGEVYHKKVAEAAVVVKGAEFPTASGATFVFPGIGPGCPAGSSGMGLIALGIAATPAPSVNTQWCAPQGSLGVPSVTTTDGVTDPVVWITTTGNQYLLGYRGDTGALIAQTGPDNDCLATITAHTTVLSAEGRLFTGGQGKVCAFGFTSG